MDDQTGQSGHRSLRPIRTVLPPEIFALITEFAETSTLLNLCLVSHAWNSFAIPVLYRRVTFDLGGTEHGDFSVFEPTLRAIIAKHGRYVRYLRLEQAYPSESDPMTWPESDNLVADAIMAMPRLKTLIWNGESPVIMNKVLKKRQVERLTFLTEEWPESMDSEYLNCEKAWNNLKFCELYGPPDDVYYNLVRTILCSTKQLEELVIEVDLPYQDDEQLYHGLDIMLDGIPPLRTLRTLRLNDEYIRGSDDVVLSLNTKMCHFQSLRNLQVKYPSSKLVAALNETHFPALRSFNFWGVYCDDLAGFFDLNTKLEEIVLWTSDTLLSITVRVLVKMKNLRVLSAVPRENPGYKNHKAWYLIDPTIVDMIALNCPNISHLRLRIMINKDEWKRLVRSLAQFKKLEHLHLLEAPYENALPYDVQAGAVEIARAFQNACLDRNGEIVDQRVLHKIDMCMLMDDEDSHYLYRGFRLHQPFKQISNWEDPLYEINATLDSSMQTHFRGPGPDLYPVRNGNYYIPLTEFPMYVP